MSLRVTWQQALLLALVLFILFPMAFLFYGSVWSSRPRAEGQFTLANYGALLSNPRTGEMLVNSLLYAAGTATVATSIGFLLAFIVTRTDAPLKRVMAFVPLIVLVTPTMVDTLAWTYLLSPRTGLINLLIGFPLFNIYSIWGMVWVMGAALIPLAYLILSGPLRKIGPSLEEAASIAGGRLRQVISAVTIPLVLPSILAVFLLTFLIGLTSVIAPLMLGIPGRVRVFTNEIYRYVLGIQPAVWGTATAWCG
ncbi:MAG: ABC transporter permease [Candidatus Geothermarchaeales archaeon]